MKCGVCGNEKDNLNYVIKERIINKGNTFNYIKCAKCGTLMLADIIEDMSVWYPQNYNPYVKVINNNETLWCKLRRKLLTEFIIRSNNEKLFQEILEKSNIDILIKRLYGTRIKKRAKILDIGCASGHWLDWLYDMGWSNITGLDLYCDVKNKKWNFIKGDIFSLTTEKYDCITLHHSFEHMDQPRKVLNKVSELLNESGLCIISIPLVDGVAWDLFGENYCQIDAPRHKYIYSEKAIKYLCKCSNLYVERVLYDSHTKIFTMSDGYKRTNKSHKELTRKDVLPQKDVEKYRLLARKSNCNHTADQAIFYIRKIST